MHVLIALAELQLADTAGSVSHLDSARLGSVWKF